MSDSTESLSSECCICCDTFTASLARTVLRCSHEFHSECIQKWSKIRNHCPVCERTISLNDDTAWRTEELQNYHQTKVRGRSSHSKADASQDKAGGQKGTKGNLSLEEETLRYYPEWNVHPTDHPSDPLVARNLAEGLILPIQAANFADMPTDWLHDGAYKYNMLAIKYSTACLARATEDKAAADRKLLQKEAQVSDLTKQLDTALARALHAESRVKELEEEALLISELKKVAESAKARAAAAETRAAAAETALKHTKEEAARKVAEVSSKVNEALLSFIR